MVELAELGKSTENTNNDDQLQPPGGRPMRKISRPKITLKMPTVSSPIAPFYNTPGGLVTIPLTPATGLPPNYPINVFEAYPNKAQEFMFKQFEGFKDFTKNTGKLGLSFGERFAFWCYGKAKGLSTNSFTHIFLLLIICLYCVLGGFVFFFIESEARQKIIDIHRNKDIKALTDATHHIFAEIRKVNESLRTRKLRTVEDSHFVIKTEIKKLEDHYNTLYHLNKSKEEFGLINSMYFCGTIFTTIEWFATFIDY